MAYQISLQYVLVAYSQRKCSNYFLMSHSVPSADCLRFGTSSYLIEVHMLQLHPNVTLYSVCRFLIMVVNNSNIFYDFITKMPKFTNNLVKVTNGIPKVTNRISHSTNRKAKKANRLANSIREIPKSINGIS